MSVQPRNQHDAEPAQPACSDGKTPPEGELTIDEYFGWLDDETHAEWVGGRVVMQVSPVSHEHNVLTRFVFHVLGHWCALHGAELCYEPFQMKLGPEGPVRSPDLLVVTREHLARITPDCLDGPADVAVEVISAGSRRRDRADKFFDYEQAGVREYWLLDPMHHVADFFQLGADGVYRAAVLEAGVYRSAVLAGLALPVEWLWHQPPLNEALRELGLI